MGNSSVQQQTNRSQYSLWRYYFNTEIILGYHTNKLVSLDGSIFYLKKENKNPENITKEIIEIISSMFYGSKEFELFKNSIDENIKLN